MKCEFCRFAPGPNSEGYYEDECPYFDKYGKIWKDGREGCTRTYAQLKKADDEYAEYLGNMGTDMGFSMDCESCGIDEQKCIKYAMHMIGMYPEGRRKPYIRHGKKFYKPYRNGWGGTNPEMERMTKSGFCKHRKSEGKLNYDVYHLTREGLDWLGRQLKIKIHDEED